MKKGIILFAVLFALTSCLSAYWIDDGVIVGSGSGTTVIGGDVYKANANTFTGINTFSAKSILSIMSGEALSLSDTLWGVDSELSGYLELGGAFDVTGQSTITTMSGEALTLTGNIFAVNAELSGYGEIGGTLAVTGTSTLAGISATNINLSTTVTANEAILVTADVSGNTELAGLLKFDSFSANPQIQKGTDTNTGIAFTGEDGFLILSGGAKVIGINNLQTIQLGNDTNNVKVAVDGYVTLTGTATVWDDLRFPATNLKVGASNAPDFVKVIDNGSGSIGVYSYGFDKTTDEQLFLTAQMPHTWKEGSDITPHIHWAPSDAGAGDVIWGYEYTWINIDGTFGNTTIVNATDTAAGVADDHQAIDFAAVSGAGKTASSILLIRIFRDANAGGDTYDNDAVLLEFDIHYEISRLGENAKP